MAAQLGSADESSRHFLSPCCSASASFSMNAGFQFDRICDTKYEHESRTSLDLSDAKNRERVPGRSEAWSAHRAFSLFRTCWLSPAR